MVKTIVNIGILAHVDAGKTSLTERLLYDQGSIRSMGSVDSGTTTTDSDDLERERGITIRSAVTSFHVGDLQVNLVDTPGHPDFIAEVERALSALDGVILVLSAVEGVQAQTKVLMRTLRKMQMPTIFFVNKIDRAGARYQSIIDEIRLRLTSKFAVLNQVDDIGTSRARLIKDTLTNQIFESDTAEAIIENDGNLIERWAQNNEIPFRDLICSLKDQTAKGSMIPLLFGSAIKGIGIESLVQGIQNFFPSTIAYQVDNSPPQGIVFAIERSYVGDKIALLRLFQGTLFERKSVTYSQREENDRIKEYQETVTALHKVIDGTSQRSANSPISGTAGDIVRVRGLSKVRVGALLGEAKNYRGDQLFRPPGLETLVKAKSPTEKAKLFAAVQQLSEEDPLIQAQLQEDGVLSIKLYGEVQKEVIQDRLRRQFNVDPDFLETRVVYSEKPVSVGVADWEYDKIDVHGNIFPIDLGIKVEPNNGGGNRYIREVKWGLVPSGFYGIVEESVMSALAQGLYGWEVSDCTVTLTKIGFEKPLTVAAHFRHLTRILFMRALKQAEVQVYEPVSDFELEAPYSSQGALLGYLGSVGVDVRHTEPLGNSGCLVSGSIPSRLVQEVTREIPSLTNGEGSLTVEPGGDQPIRGTPPTRQRTDGNPLDFKNYLKYLERNKAF